MTDSTAVRAASRFKQLSCFGLEKEAVIPELLNELHALVPSFANSFFFANERGGIGSAYFESTDAIKVYPLYQEEFHDRREREFRGYSFYDAARTQIGVQDFQTFLSVDDRTFHRSDLYNIIVRPAGYDNNFLRLYFRDRGKVLGGLTMWRTRGAGRWTSEDKRRLASLETFFVHALTGRGAAGETPLVDSGRVGLIIADGAGKPIHFSAEGRRLLFLATNSEGLTSRALIRTDTLPAPVIKLCRNLSRIFSGDETDLAPTHYHSNAWGGFTFRAECLEPADPTLIGVTISHHVPLPIRLMRGAQKLPLSRRQTEVCVLMATGASNEAIAERLGISKHTANEHGRWIYHRLDVHSRTELVNKMLSG